MHQISGVRDPGAAFILRSTVDETGDRRQANLAVGWGGAGLAVTGLIELALALLSGSVALLGDALHNLSDVSTSVLVFVGFRASKRLPTDRYPYGFDRAEDLAGVGIAVVIWVSAAFAGVESVRKLLGDGATHHVGWAITGAAVGILGNQIVARIKLRIGKRINSATLIADAKHSWLDALSSTGALIGLVGVFTGLKWADAVAGIVVTGFICHVGWEVSSEIVHRLMDGVDPEIITAVEQIAADVPGVHHAHARARWTGRILRVEVEGWIDAQTTVTEADRLGQTVADRLAVEIPSMRNFTWSARGV
jgi:cation diffusion facilitator family transporter